MHFRSRRQEQVLSCCCCRLHLRAGGATATVDVVCFVRDNVALPTLCVQQHVAAAAAAQRARAAAPPGSAKRLAREGEGEGGDAREPLVSAERRAGAERRARFAALPRTPLSVVEWGPAGGARE